MAVCKPNFCPGEATEAKVPTKIEFLNNLKLAVANLQSPLILAGDFNLIADAGDKNNSNINRGLMSAFRQFINELELKDLYLHGRRYTWCNEHLNATLCRPRLRGYGKKVTYQGLDMSGYGDTAGYLRIRMGYVSGDFSFKK